MAKLVFYSFLLLLLCVILRASTGFPVNAKQHADCVPLFKSLLQNVADLFSSPVLCFGIPSVKVAITNQTETVNACAPIPTPNSGCVFQRNSSFSESECWRNIMTDLAHYDAAIKFYLRSPLRLPKNETALLEPTRKLIGRLRNESCWQSQTKDDSAEKAAAQMWGNDSFTNRDEMCKLLRGFHIRAVTMNRAVRYMSSGDHRK